MPSPRNCHTLTQIANRFILLFGKEGDEKRKFIMDVWAYIIETGIW